MPINILQLPPDASGVEKKIIEYAYAHIYRTLEDPLDKFIVAFMFDLGNNVTATAIACNLHRKSLVICIGKLFGRKRRRFKKC